MRCPACGRETTPALSRCTHCGAPLDDATSHDPPAWGADGAMTARDPGSGPRPWEPVAPPWGAAPGSVPVPDAPPETPGERTMSLSQEPWNDPPIWQPPPPPARRGPPYLLIAAGVAFLTVVALLIVFWPAGDRSAPSPGAASAPATSPGESGEPEPSTEESPGGDAAQARAVDALLTEMATTRADLGGVVQRGCLPGELRDIRSARQEQLGRAQSLEVSGLPEGTALREALTSALQASVDSNDRYLTYAPGCPSDGDSVIASANDRASAAKRTFLGLWNPIAQEQGLTTRSEATI